MPSPRRPSCPRAAALAVMLAAAGIPAVALAQSPPSAAATPAAVAAQGRFDRGRALFQQDHFAEALPEFRASLELFRSPNTRLYVGLCLQRLGRFADAFAELSRTAAEAGDLVATDRRYEGARDLARRSLAEVEPRVAQLSVRVVDPPPGVTVRVGTTTLDAAALGVAIPFDPAEVTVVAEAPGFLPTRQSVRLTPGGRATIELAMRRAPVTAGVTPPVTTPGEYVPPTRRGGGVRVAGFVVAGLGAASLVTFGVLGGMASSQYDDLSRVCPVRACGPAQVAQIDDGVGLTTGANVMLGVGIVAAVAGVVMIAVGGPKAATEPAAMAYVDPASGTVGVRGAF
jgi:hypothetical protein